MSAKQDFVRLSYLSEIMGYNLVSDITLFSDLSKKSYFITPEKFHIVLSLTDGQTLQASDECFDQAIDKIYKSFKDYLNADQN
jgi:hypothetical protein